MSDHGPVGGTHLRTTCQSCEGAWQHPEDQLVQVRFGDKNPIELLCDTCTELTWGQGIGDYE